jgi:hypothetical protein
MYYDRKILESINKSKQIWTLIKDGLGNSDRRQESISINNNGYVISEPTKVATLILTLLRQQKGYSVISLRGHLNIPTLTRKFLPQCFLHRKMTRKLLVLLRL